MLEEEKVVNKGNFALLPPPAGTAYF